jgi:hypothetical protein
MRANCSACDPVDAPLVVGKGFIVQFRMHHAMSGQNPQPTQSRTQIDHIFFSQRIRMKQGNEQTEAIRPMVETWERAILNR